MIKGNNIFKFKITGGIFNHTSTTRFEGTDQQITIVQRYHGLNVWDQLAVDIEIFGDIPEIPIGSTVSIPDLTEEYTFSTDSSLQTIGNGHRLTVNDKEIEYSIEQHVCGHV